MTNALRLLATILLTAVVGPQVGFTTDHAASSPAAESAPEMPAPEAPWTVETRGLLPVAAAPGEQLVVVDANADQLEQLDAAIATFEDAGLELPPLVVTFDQTGEACKGHPGYFTPGTPAEIGICDDLRHVLLHQLAHAWEWHIVDDSAREHFVAERGLSTWSSKDVEWGDRGIEQFADIVAIGLVLTDSSNERVVEKLCIFEDITAVDHGGVGDDDCHDDHDHA